MHELNRSRQRRVEERIARCASPLEVRALIPRYFDRDDATQFHVASLELYPSSMSSCGSPSDGNKLRVSLWRKPSMQAICLPSHHEDGPDLVDLSSRLFPGNWRKASGSQAYSSSHNGTSTRWRSREHRRRSRSGSGGAIEMRPCNKRGHSKRSALLSKTYDVVLDFCRIQYPCKFSFPPSVDIPLSQPT